MDKIHVFVNGFCHKYKMRFLVETKDETKIRINLCDKNKNSITHKEIVNGLKVIVVNCSKFMRDFNWKRETYRKITYTVDLDHEKKCIIGSFPLIKPKHKKHLKVASVSCNCNQREDDNNDYGYERVDQGVDMWGTLADIDVDLIVHCGDQIYGDEIFKRRIGYLKEINYYDEDVIYDAYAALYRTAYSEKSQALAMMNALNVMVVDDHDFDDSFGTPDEGREKKDEEFTPYYRAAMRAFLNYQYSLFGDWSDYDYMTSGEYPFYYSFDLGRYCFVVLEERIEWYHKGLVFSDEQMEWLDTILGKTNRDIILISPRPVGHTNRLNAKIQGYFAPDGKDELLHPITYRRTVMLINLLAKHVKNNPITIMSGDVHKTYINEIYKGDKLVAKHLCASAITRKPKCFDPCFTRVGYSFQQFFTKFSMGDITFTDKRAVSNNNNYGLFIDGRLVNVYIKDP